MSRTVISPKLTRRQLRSDALNSQKLSPRKTCHSPEKSSEEDTKDMLIDQDETDDTELHCDDKSVKQRSLYPDPNIEDECGETYLGLQTRNISGSHKTALTSEYKERHSRISSPGKMQPKGFLIKIFAIIIICIIALFYFYYEPVHGSAESPPKDSVTKIVDKLQTEFVDQSNLSFRIIKSALNNVIQNTSEPNAPAVLLLVSSKGAKDVTMCFAKQLANLVASGDQNYQTIYGNELKHEDPDKAKKQIDNVISDTLYHKEQKVVLIENLDTIPSKAAMMLHSYCDDQNAPFKSAVFIMTIDADTDISDNANSRQFDRAADLRLTSVWNDLGEDKLNPLLSRITVSVAAIYRKTMPRFCNQFL